MNKLILVLFLVAASICNADAQTKRRKSQFQPNEYGVGMTIGGCGLLALSLTTAPIYQTVSPSGTYSNVILSNTSSKQVQQPFFQQGARTYAICTGVTLTLTGVITMLVSR